MTAKEMALQVAEACGFEIQERLEDVSIKRPWNRKPDGEPEWCLFEPDISESDAVLAAEKYGLFMAMNCELHGAILESIGKTGWGVTHREPHKATTLIGSGTFCEAICQAILYLEASKPSK